MTEWLNAEQAAQIMGGEITANTLRTLARAKKIQHTHVNRKLVFERSWLDDYLFAHAIPVKENPYGLTDAALRNVQDDYSGRGRKAS